MSIKTTTFWDGGKQRIYTSTEEAGITHSSIPVNGFLVSGLVADSAYNGPYERQTQQYWSYMMSEWQVYGTRYYYTMVGDSTKVLYWEEMEMAWFIGSSDFVWGSEVSTTGYNESNTPPLTGWTNSAVLEAG